MGYPKLLSISWRFTPNYWVFTDGLPQTIEHFLMVCPRLLSIFWWFITLACIFHLLIFLSFVTHCTLLWVKLLVLLLKSLEASGSFTLFPLFLICSHRIFSFKVCVLNFYLALFQSYIFWGESNEVNGGRYDLISLYMGMKFSRIKRILNLACSD